MARLVVDIETLGYPFESLDEQQQEYLLKYAQSEEEREEQKQKLSLYPTTAQIIAIGMLNPDSNNAKILFQADEVYEKVSDDGTVQYIATTEKAMLTQFWNDVQHYQQLITFNGRGFDFPFLMLRSAILGIKPTRNLLGNRYDVSSHCDLLEQFTFYGALRKFNLDFYCKAFGIVSPKSHGITGLDLHTLFAEKRYFEIAEYNLWDLQATAELYRRWEQFLNV